MPSGTIKRRRESSDQSPSASSAWPSGTRKRRKESPHQSPSASIASRRPPRAAAMKAKQKWNELQDMEEEEAELENAERKEEAAMTKAERKEAARVAAQEAAMVAQQEAEAKARDQLEDFKNNCLTSLKNDNPTDSKYPNLEEITEWLINAENYSLPYVRKPLKDYTEILQSNQMSENMLIKKMETAKSDKAQGENQLANSDLEYLANTTFITASKEGHKTLVKNKKIDIDGDLAESAGDLAESAIANDCIKNWENNTICYCCGNIMVNDHKKHQCDHFIPVLQMLACIRPGSCGKNLHYICTGCNSKKSNTSLLHLWHNCGTDFYPRSKDPTALAETMAPPGSTPQSRARDRIKGVLSKLKFNTKADHNLIQLIMRENKDKVIKLFEDIKQSFKFEDHAKLLLNFSNAAVAVAPLMHQSLSPPTLSRSDTNMHMMDSLKFMAEKFIYSTKEPPYMPSLRAAEQLYKNERYIKELPVQMQIDLEWAGVGMLFNKVGRRLFDAKTATVYDYKGYGEFDIAPIELTEEQKKELKIPKPRPGGGKFIKHTKIRKSKKRKITKNLTLKKRRLTKKRKPTKRKR